MALSLLGADLPPDHGFLQPIHRAQSAHRGSASPKTGNAAAARRTA